MNKSFVVNESLSICVIGETTSVYIIERILVLSFQHLSDAGGANNQKTATYDIELKEIRYRQAS